MTSIRVFSTVEVPLPKTVGELAQHIEKNSRNRCDPLEEKRMGEVMLFQVFMRCDFEDLGRFVQVSKRWHHVMSTNTLFKEKFALKEKIGKEVWERYIGKVGIEPNLPMNIGEILNSPCPFWPNRKVYRTHVLVLFPKTVDGVPLTIKSMSQLVQKPKEGYTTRCLDFTHKMDVEYGDQGIENSYWVILTKEVIPESRGKSFGEQSKLIQSLGGGAYKVPKLLEAIAAIFMHRVVKGDYLYPKEPSLTMMRCQEMISGSHVIVGAYSADGLLAGTSIHEIRDTFGMGALRAFD